MEKINELAEYLSIAKEKREEVNKAIDHNSRRFIQMLEDTEYTASRLKMYECAISDAEELLDDDDDSFRYTYEAIAELVRYIGFAETVIKLLK